MVRARFGELFSNADCAISTSISRNIRVVSSRTNMSKKDVWDETKVFDSIVRSFTPLLCKRVPPFDVLRMRTVITLIRSYGEVGDEDGAERTHQNGSRDG